MQKLPTFGKLEPSEETPEGVDSPLDQDFEDAVSLLWDMSAETDVIHFLMSHSILTLIRDTVDTDKCPTRLKASLKFTSSCIRYVCLVDNTDCYVCYRKSLWESWPTYFPVQVFWKFSRKKMKNSIWLTVLSWNL